MREWLAATFTRQTAKRREPPKFKSVANAIRTGIMFDKCVCCNALSMEIVFCRMFRKNTTIVAPIPPDLQAMLQKVNEWDHSPFALNEASDGHALKYVGFELFNRFGFLEQYRVSLWNVFFCVKHLRQIPWQTLENYLLALDKGYSKHNNPYHNLVHAADVAQSSSWMLCTTGLSVRRFFRIV